MSFAQQAPGENRGINLPPAMTKTSPNHRSSAGKGHQRDLAVRARPPSAAWLLIALAGAGVLFCQEGGRPASAVTDKEGRFRLRTWSEADGTLAGTHVVCATKTVPTTAESDNPYTETRNILPSRYASPVTSPLRADVDPAGDNVFRFEFEP